MASLSAVRSSRRPVYSSQSERGLLWRARSILDHRNLIWELTMRNIKIRYRRSVFGFLWAILNPILTSLVFALVFTVLLRSSIERFPLFFVTGLVAWNAFAASVMESMAIITGSSNLVTRVRFPHEVLPIATTLTNMINLIFALPSIAIMMIATRTPLEPQVIYLPFVLLCLFCFSLGISFFAAATAVFFRDTRNFLDVVMNLWFFLTPIIYDINQVFGKGQRIIYWVNPPASIISSFRLMFYNLAWPAPSFLARLLLSCVITMFAGWFYFVKLSPKFAEEM